MLNQLRNVTFIKAMMWIVAGSFVGLMVFDWGADIGGRRGAGPVGDSVGSINGQEISYKLFDKALRNAYAQAKDKEGGEPDLGQLIQQTWNGFVGQTLMAQQIAAYELSVSDAEVDFVNRNNPIPPVQNEPSFQVDGKFDPAKYAQVLDDPGTYRNPGMKQFVLSVESQTRQQLLQGRLQEVVASGVRVTTGEVRRAYLDENEKVTVGYVGVDATGFADSLVTVSDAEARAYYDAHLDEYQQETSIKAAFVSFPKAPSPQDEATTESEIRSLSQEVRSGGDFDAIARQNSDDPGSAQRGGDLGFFGRGRMVKAFEDSAFSLAPGTVSEPFLTRFGWHIVKVEERKGEGDSLQVRARHILLTVQPGRATLDSIRMRVEEFVEATEEKGFDAVAAQFGLQTQETGYIAPGAFFPLLGNKTAGFVNGFLAADPGTVERRETEQGLYVFSLREKRPAGPRPFAEVEGRILSTLRREKKVALAADRIQPVLDLVRSGKTLEEAAVSSDQPYTKTKPFARTGFVPGVGSRNAFVGKAYGLETGTVSGIVRTDRGAYILEVLERQPVDETKFQEENQTLAARMLNQKRNEFVGAWFSDLQKNADIVDNRHFFYTDY
jgi:peptidyl-prolyl cis-trans isomerase D